jgi:hypothetical protein
MQDQSFPLGAFDGSAPGERITPCAHRVPLRHELTAHQEERVEMQPKIIYIFTWLILPNEPN